MRAVFRTDASRIMGSGHVMRCLTLASALRERGATISFVCREHSGHLCDLIEERGFSVSRLPAPAADYRADALPVHAAWLGAPWQEDVNQTRAALAATDATTDWLVVDHYAVDHCWERALRSSAERIMVIDDLADRIHDCDLLLDQNLVAETRTRRAGKTPEACRLLLGPAYALLQPIYAQFHGRIPPRGGPIRRLLIYFGGTDNDNLTGRTLDALRGLNRPDIDVDVVISSASHHAETIRKQIAGRDHIHLHSGLLTLAPLMARADLAIGASGATSWERLCLGLPALVVTLAENQRAIAEELSEQGMICWLGDQQTVDESTLAQALLRHIQQGVDEAWSRRCLAAVDGKGVDRVCAAMTVTAFTPLRIRHATPEDEDLLRECSFDTRGPRNDAAAEGVTSATHRVWFRSRLRDVDGCHLYVAETPDGVALGHVRFERQEQARTFYSLLPVFRGRGVERVLLDLALQRLRADERGALIFAPITDGHDPSRSGIESSGSEGPIEAGAARWSLGVCSDSRSWINTFIPELIIGWLTAGHQVSWSHDAAALPVGDLCFYLGYGQIVGPELLARHRNNLVVHESDLPRGRGWSPLTWQVLEGAEVIPVTLFEAADSVDSGPIYLQTRIALKGDELVDELRRRQAAATLLLCRRFLDDYPMIVGKSHKQMGEASSYRRRRPEDGRLTVDKTLRDQFSLLRVSDNERYPAWFEMAGTKYLLRIEKADR